ncbi:MAG TPA: hypothetical protein VG817_02030 [Gemmatimonadales bacterium]|nr:hypothetical protein [Gemmatimonadales bacterium]
MTAPIGFRTVHPPVGPSGASRPPVFAPRPLPVPQPLNVAEELTAAGARPIPQDQLDLIRALVEAGKFGRAIELLDAVWKLDAEHEQAWFLRLWATVGEGKVAAALDLARSITPRLPGSAAIAFLQAHLEAHRGDLKAALEVALRGSAAAPDRAEVTALVQRLVARVAEDRAGRAAVPVEDRAAASQPQPGPVSLLGAALQGAALLHPAGSNRAHVPVTPPRIRQPERVKPRQSPLGRRFGFLALATVVAALWAIPDPIPAALTLTAVVVLVTRLPAPRR